MIKLAMKNHLASVSFLLVPVHFYLLSNPLLRLISHIRSLNKCKRFESFVAGDNNTEKTVCSFALHVPRNSSRCAELLMQCILMPMHPAS